MMRWGVVLGFVLGLLMLALGLLWQLDALDNDEDSDGLAAKSMLGRPGVLP